MDSAQLACAATSSVKPHTTSIQPAGRAALSSMCRGPEIELVDKDDDVTTILVDDDKWDELASDTPTAYSRKPIITLCFAMFANSVALTNVFPYAGFMILHYGLTADETRVGFYAGYSDGVLHGRAAAVVVYCGALSDRIGRKAVIRIGLWSCLVFSIGFGFSPPAIALSMRLCMGLFNGLTGVAKAAIPEIVPKGPEQQTAMGYVAGMWRTASSLTMSRHRVDGVRRCRPRSHRWSAGMVVGPRPAACWPSARSLVCSRGILISCPTYLPRFWRC